MKNFKKLFITVGIYLYIDHVSDIVFHKKNTHSDE